MGVLHQFGEPFTNHGSVSGYSYGVEIVGGTSSVTNLGGCSITATATEGVGVTVDGTVTNFANASISGGGNGVNLGGAGAKLTNAGSIVGKTGMGVSLNDGGAVTNLAHGEIAGSVGVDIVGAVGQVTNAGVINSYAGSAIALLNGGVVTNQAGVIRSPTDVAVDIENGKGVVINRQTIATARGSAAVLLSFGGTVDNFGRIANFGSTADNQGVVLAKLGAVGPATVRNEARGQITAGGNAITVELAPGKVVNAGLLKSSAAIGVDLIRGGTVTNSASGEISAFDSAVGGIIGGFTVTNFGSITSAKSAGVQGAFGPNTVINSGSIKGEVGVAFGGGKVTNKSHGTIAGVDTGVILTAGGSVTDAGAISGGTHSVEFEGAGVFALTLTTGALLTGAAIGSTEKGATNKLVLLGSGKAEDGFLDFNTMSEKATGTWTLGGHSTVGESTIWTGTLDVAGALTTLINEKAGTTLTFAAGGELTLKKGSSVLSGSVTGAGTVDLESGALATLYGNVGVDDTFAFTGANSILGLHDLSVGQQLFHGEIAGFGTGDYLDVGASLGGTGATPLHFAGGMLHIDQGTFHASLAVEGSYVTSDFRLAGGDGHGGTLITYR
jgi:hypothetical protein